jgi:predicted nucleic acid-binding protein
MAKKVLETSVLLHHWGQSGGNSPASRTVDEAKNWGKELVRLHGTDAIVTPVYLEMVVGVQSAHQLDLMRAFLGEFRIIDNWNVTPEDWKEARRIGERVPRDGHRRQLGDCLIRAIANRLRHDVIAFDRRFAR